MKALEWISSSKKDLLTFPEDVRKEIGYALYLAQNGDIHQNTKPFKGFGSGVYEIVSDYDKNTYRSVYIVNLYDRVYVLHCFQKKSKSGIATPKEEINVIEQRLKFIKSMSSKRI